MTYIRENQWRVALVAYVVGGAAIGLALPAMKAFASAQLGRSGYAVFFDINILLPSFIVGMAAFYPRYKVAVGGTFCVNGISAGRGAGPQITPPSSSR
jgi:hypothetical protein